MLLWMRAEWRATEQRAPIVPSDVPGLLADGIDLVVERSAHRAFPDAEYAACGARLAAPQSWPDAPAHAYVLGLKELPARPWPLRHRHVYFGHAFKGQPGADELLARFAAGGGELLDLEYLCDAAGRRLAAFGYWAGYVGAALAVLHRAGRLPVPLRAVPRAELDDRLAAVDTGPDRALVLGALGRCGSGARAALDRAGVLVTAWDVAETVRLDRAALLDHELLVNCVLTREPREPYLREADLRGAHRLAVLADVTCDVGSPGHLFPCYDRTTSWARPVRRGAGGAGPDVIAIDNLPSLLPREASASFSRDLRYQLRALPDPDGVWATSRAAFRGGHSHRSSEELSVVR
jgi:saccharopine dehydrogenase (NAD+, L-lysine-forming)